MSLYANYLRERSFDEILEVDKGFATYRYLDNKKTVYIVDIYVLPEFRKEGIAKKLADAIVMNAVEQGCTKLLGSVVPSAKGSTESIKVLIAYGMTLESSSNDFIVFKKEL